MMGRGSISSGTTIAMLCSVVALSACARAGVTTAPFTIDDMRRVMRCPSAESRVVPTEICAQTYDRRTGEDLGCIPPVARVVDGCGVRVELMCMVSATDCFVESWELVGRQPGH